MNHLLAIFTGSVVCGLLVMAAIFVAFCAGLPEHRNPRDARRSRMAILAILTLAGVTIALLTGCRVPGVDQHEHPARAIQGYSSNEAIPPWIGPEGPYLPH